MLTPYDTLMNAPVYPKTQKYSLSRRSNAIFPGQRHALINCNRHLDPLTESAKIQNYILAITDCFFKLVRSVPPRSITASTIVKVLMRDFVFVYGPPALLLSYNGTQFTYKLFQSVCQSILVSNIFTTTYHPHTNDQTEIFNFELFAKISKSIWEHTKRWHEYTSALAFAYNTQHHKNTAVKLLELVMSRNPGLTTIKVEPSLAASNQPRNVRIEFLAQMRRLVLQERSTLNKAQALYKRDFCRRAVYSFQSPLVTILI